MTTIKKGEPGYDDYKRRMADYMKKQYDNNTVWVREYKISQGCMDCGWNKHHAGLEFDHRAGRGDGDRTVASIMGGTPRYIREEIAKCDVVCGTCHRIRTWDRLQLKIATASGTTE